LSFFFFSPWLASPFPRGFFFAFSFLGFQSPFSFPLNVPPDLGVWQIFSFVARANVFSRSFKSCQILPCSKPPFSSVCFFPPLHSPRALVFWIAGHSFFFCLCFMPLWKFPHFQGPFLLDPPLSCRRAAVFLSHGPFQLFSLGNFPNPPGGFPPQRNPPPFSCKIEFLPFPGLHMPFFQVLRFEATAFIDADIAFCFGLFPPLSSTQHHVERNTRPFCVFFYFFSFLHPH